MNFLQLLKDEKKKIRAELLGESTNLQNKNKPLTENFQKELDSSCRLVELSSIKSSIDTLGIENYRVDCDYKNIYYIPDFIDAKSEEILLYNVEVCGDVFVDKMNERGE